jgi:hypothetical protein
MIREVRCFGRDQAPSELLLLSRPGCGFEDTDQIVRFFILASHFSPNWIVQFQRRPGPSTSRALQMIVAVLLELKICRISEALLPLLDASGNPANIRGSGYFE